MLKSHCIPPVTSEHVVPLIEAAVPPVRVTVAEPVVQV